MTDSITANIKSLQKERNAVILAHNYQLPEVQDIADYVGDSLGLSQQAAKTDADVIVFCGVYFMAETASVLCPDKTVLMPDKNAGCPMADMITANQLREMKQQHPDAVVICYVNSTADVKAESDCCCTSSNAVAVVESYSDADEIIFVPDKYLGHYAAMQTGQELIFWNGYCPTHVRITAEQILKMKEQHPQAVVLAHPECTPSVIDVADQALSTGGMCNFVQTSSAQEFIVATEAGLVHSLSKQNPLKTFLPILPAAVCPNMKMTNTEKILWALQDMQHQVTVPEDIRANAKKSILRMLEITS